MLTHVKKYRKPICLAVSVIVSLLFIAIANNKIVVLSIKSYIAFFIVDAIFLAGYVISNNRAWTRQQQARTASILALGFAIGCVLHVVFLVPNLELVSFDGYRLLEINWIWLIAFALGPALLEEALLRGYLSDFLSHFGIALLIALLLQGALFAAAHFVPNNLPRTGFFCALAVLFTVARIHFDNLAWSVGAHFGWNLLAAIIYGVPASVANSTGFVPLSAISARNYYLLIFFCLTISIYFLHKLHKQRRVFSKYGVSTVN